MSKITQLNDKAWCTEVPDWSKDWYITNIHADNDLVCPSKYGGVHWIGMLPPGSYSILGKGNEITEDQWKGVVDKDERTVTNGTRDTLISGFKDYERHGGSSIFMVKRTATESGISLLKSKGLNPKTTFILVKTTT